MNDTLEDERDRTIFVEYYPSYCLTSVWQENGTLDFFDVEPVINGASN